MYFKLWMWVWVVSFEHSFHNCQALWKRTLFFQNPKMKLVLSIYSCWNCFVFLLMKVVFLKTTFLKKLCYVEILKQNLFWIIVTWAFMWFYPWKQSSACCIILLAMKACVLCSLKQPLAYAHSVLLHWVQVEWV
jgi:hypothetical protein